MQRIKDIFLITFIIITLPFWVLVIILITLNTKDIEDYYD
jgi:hypothetical protein